MHQIYGVIVFYSEIADTIKFSDTIFLGGQSI